MLVSARLRLLLSVSLCPCPHTTSPAEEGVKTSRQVETASRAPCAGGLPHGRCMFGVAHVLCT